MRKAPLEDASGTANHSCPTEGPLDASAAALGGVPQARPAVELESTPSAWPVAALVITKEPSPLAAKVHASRLEPVAAARDVIADPPETWARTRPSPLAIRYVFNVSTGGGAGEVESTVTLAYSASDVAHATTQYDRKLFPMIIELVLFTLSRNQRYQESDL
jgi:hypothetical protein